MNNTLIESINKITKIKSDLNQILVENGVGGSDVFTDYPDMFRELFRVTDILTDGTLEGIDTSTSTESYAVIADPVMSVYQNVVTINCATAEATIYYWIVTDSGNNNVGVGPLTGKTVVCTESCTVWCYAQYREERSNEISIHCEVAQIVVPDPPRITRDGTTVTIEKFSEDDIIYYTLDGSWAIYTAPLTVPRTSNVFAFTQNYRGRSTIIVDEAPEKPVAPAKPSISFYHNVVTITCTTENAAIYYRTDKNNTWIEYTEPVEILETAIYEAKSSKNDIDSEETVKMVCIYVAQPNVPEINVSNNKVYITCSTNGATIYYKVGSGDYQQYVEPITLTETILVTTKSKYDWRYSDESEATTCTYIDPATLVPAVPTISCSDNVVTMLCSTVNATIKYRIYGSDSEWTTYTGPFEINATATYEAYSTKNGYDSDPCSAVTCTYVEPATPEPPATVSISCSDNVVTMSCSTINATIYYRKSTDSSWTIYTEPISITENTIFIARSFKNELYSEQTTYTATYVPGPVIIVPDEPEITCNMNVVTITCDTEDAVVYYSIDYNNYTVYNGPIRINSDVTVRAYSILNEQTSTVISLYCQYFENPYETEYLFIEALGEGDFCWCLNKGRKTGTTFARYIYGSFDKINWFKIIEAVHLNAGDKLYLKGNNRSLNTIKNYSDWDSEEGFWYTITFNNSYNAGGNVMSLYYEDNFVNKNFTTTNPGELFRLFSEITSTTPGNLKNCNKLVLGSKNTKDYCYFQMFYNCKGLITPPEIKTTSLSKGCYKSMFCGCTSLTIAPELPITNLYEECYFYMFNGCASLITAPVLPATTLANYCYRAMFLGCTSLITAPELPATSLTTECYRAMFQECTSLVNAPVLPATTLANYCYETMFWKCTSLITAPELPALSMKSSCYCGMFYECTSLTTAPTTLPATWLAVGCYSQMFEGCTSLTTAPILPHETLTSAGRPTSSCYYRMFANCEALNYIKCLAILPSNVESYNCILEWVKNVSSTGTFVKASGATWPSGESGIPSGWTIQNAA